MSNMYERFFGSKTKVVEPIGVFAKPKGPEPKQYQVTLSCPDGTFRMATDDYILIERIRTEVKRRMHGLVTDSFEISMEHGWFVRGSIFSDARHVEAIIPYKAFCDGDVTFKVTTPWVED